MSNLFKNWNWGKSIAAVIVLLCSGIIFIVYKATTYHYDLVLDNYYEEELHFNDQATAISNASELTEAVKLIQEKDYLLIEFPKECLDKKLDGTVHLYRASDATKDLKVPINFVSGTIVSIPQSQIIKGNYHAIIQWNMDSKTYKVVKDFEVL